MDIDTGSDSTVQARSSKYDYVKIRVWLHHTPATAQSHNNIPNNDTVNHWYVLSRYVLSRLISSCTGLRSNVAVTIALQLKKNLVDNGQLDITQAELNEYITQLIQQYNSTQHDAVQYPQYVDQYNQLQQWQSAHICTIILIAGTYGCNKHMIGARLANKLNISNTIHTDTILALNDAHSTALPVYLRRYSDTAELITTQQDICRAVYEQLLGELHKCSIDGRTVILVGSHIDIPLYEQYVDTVQRTQNVRIQLLPYLIHVPAVQHKLTMHNRLLQHNNTHHADTQSTCHCEQHGVLQRIDAISQWYTDRVPQCKQSVQQYTVGSINQTVQAIHSDVMQRIMHSVSQ